MGQVLQPATRESLAALTARLDAVVDGASARDLTGVADELFAVDRLAELIADQSVEAVVVDTAPTGHFLRLLELKPLGPTKKVVVRSQE